MVVFLILKMLLNKKKVQKRNRNLKKISTMTVIILLMRALIMKMWERVDLVNASKSSDILQLLMLGNQYLVC